MPAFTALGLPGPADLAGSFDPHAELIERILRAVDEARAPELLRFGGEEAFERYRAVFDRLYYSTKPIVDPREWAVVLKPDYCRHICIREERFDKRRKRTEGEERVREEWDQARAEYIPWILTALRAPCFIVRNNQQPGNQVYLFGDPRGAHRPRRRYYVSVTPAGRRRAVLKTAYPISQEQWDKALRAHPHEKGRGHVLYRRPTPRW